MSQTHTPGIPDRLEFDPENHGNSNKPGYGILTDYGRSSRIHVEGCEDDAIALSKEVVRRWNAHDDLVAALRACAETLRAIEATLARIKREWIVDTRSDENQDAITDLLAEIDRLNADRDQLSNALDLSAAELESQTSEIGRLNKVVDQACEIIGELLGDEDRPLKTRPALAAELERRSKA